MQRTFTVLTGLMLFLGGCASMVRTEAPQPTFYQLEYEARAIDCQGSFNEGVRVWNFTASMPYNRTQMVVLGPEREVIFSRNYQWVAGPGNMLSETIQRDLSQGDIFSRVVGTDDPANVTLELTGNIHKFACQRTNSQCRAVLNVEITLARTGVDREQIFHNTYNLRSEPFKEGNSALFAEAMSRIVGEFSRDLRKDLCRAAGSYDPK